MAYEEALQVISLPVNLDMGANQYHFVVVGSDGNLDLAGDGAAADGVLQDKPDGSSVETAGSVAIGGVSKVEAGEAIDAGDFIASNATGEAKTATTGDIVLGRALTAASGDGVIFSMIVYHTNEPLA